MADPIDTSGLPPAMTEEEARAEIVLFGETASVPVLSDPEIDVLVAKAKRADYLRRPPSHEFWRPTWCIAYALSLAWRIKAGRLAGRTAFSIRGQSFNRDQFYRHCLEQSDLWAKRVNTSFQMDGSWRRKLISSGTLLGDVQTNGILEDDYLP